MYRNTLKITLCNNVKFKVYFKRKSLYFNNHALKKYTYFDVLTNILVTE